MLIACIDLFPAADAVDCAILHETPLFGEVAARSAAVTGSLYSDILGLCGLFDKQWD